MGTIAFRLIPHKDHRVSVEMVKPNGKPRLIPDFRDEADATAWIIQMQRLLQAVHPYLPGVKHRSSSGNYP